MLKYIKIILTFIICCMIIGTFTSCGDYVQSVEPPIDDVADDKLNTPADVPFLVTGIQTAFSIVWDETSNFAGGLSDEMEFTRDIKQATFPTFEAIDMAEVTGLNPLLPQNNSTEGIMTELGQLRLYADTLIERIENRITFDTTDAHKAIKNDGLFTGYFYGAVARFIWGAYWALEAGDGGGGVINLSPYIPAADMYNDALNRLDQAVTYGTPDQKKMAHSLKARILLIMGRYNDVTAEADQGLTAGDAPYSALYNTIQNNYWYYWAGPGRTQFHAADRFGDYVYNDPNEANRIPTYYIAGVDSIFIENDTIMGGYQYTAGDTTLRQYVQQFKYDDLDSPLAFLTWQENTLMKAEVLIRGGDNAGGLAFINEVRTSHSLDPLTDTDVTDMYGGDYLELIYAERDKELCFTGMRLIDQRRFDKWHLDPINTWQHFPISKEERDINPNF